MTDHDHDLDSSALARRHLLRGGAVLAGAAGLTAVGAALAPKASATNGSAILQGAVNSSGTTTNATTEIRISSTTSLLPSLTLSHGNQNAPQLALTPRPVFDDSSLLPDLKAGEVLNTDLGPYIGLSDGASVPTVVTGYLATNFDLDAKAEALAVNQQRVLDTGTVAGRTSIRRRSSTGAVDSSGRLLAASWIDIVVASDQTDGVIDAAFFNLICLTPASRGYLTAYPPPASGNAVPFASTLNFPGGTTVGNFAFIGVRYVSGEYLLRIYASTTTRVIVDLNGYAQRGPSAEPITPSTNARRKAPFAARRVLPKVRKR